VEEEVNDYKIKEIEAEAEVIIEHVKVIHLLNFSDSG
jgi:hypothetical protein